MRTAVIQLPVTPAVLTEWLADLPGDVLIEAFTYSKSGRRHQSLKARW